MSKHKSGLPYVRAKKSRNVHGRTTPLGREIIQFCDKEPSIKGIAAGFLATNCRAARPPRVKIRVVSGGYSLWVRSKTAAQEMKVYVNDADEALKALILFLTADGISVEAPVPNDLADEA